MEKIIRILKQLSGLYEFNRRIKGYTLRKREENDPKKLARPTVDRRTP